MRCNKMVVNGPDRKHTKQLISMDRKLVEFKVRLLTEHCYLRKEYIETRCDKQYIASEYNNWKKYNKIKSIGLYFYTNNIVSYHRRVDHLGLLILKE